MIFGFTEITQVWEHYFKLNNRVQSTQDEKARFIKGNELKLTQVELFSFFFFLREYTQILRTDWKNVADSYKTSAIGLMNEESYKKLMGMNCTIAGEFSQSRKSRLQISDIIFFFSIQPYIISQYLSKNLTLLYT